MGIHGDGTRRQVRAVRLRTGDRLVLDGFTREVVHVQRFGVRVEADTTDTTETLEATGSTQGGGTVPAIRVRVAFVNGSSITVPHDQMFEVCTAGSGR